MKGKLKGNKKVKKRLLFKENLKLKGSLNCQKLIIMMSKRSNNNNNNMKKNR